MNETASLALPLIQPSQAQKHVTVNEALVRLDGLAQITLLSRRTAVPPSNSSEGDCYAVPAAPSGSWVGKAGMLAIHSNGGWIFVQPQSGWSGWIKDEHSNATYLQGEWHAGVLGAATNGGRSFFSVLSLEHVIVAGGAQSVALDIPANSVVFACSARVKEDLTGGMTTWSMDFPDVAITFGTGMGLSVGSYCTGILSQPTAIYATQQPRLTPIGGDFATGRLEIAAHFYSIGLPD